MTVHVLIVAGTDSSGGAGLSRDVEIVAAFGLRSAVAVTAVTVQTHESVRRIEVVPAEVVADQMRAALESNRVAGIKIGMLTTAETIDAVSSVIAQNPDVPVVLDPVMASSSGRTLLPPEAVGLLRQRLMPLCRIVTPNVPELAMLTGEGPSRNEPEILHQAAALLDAGAAAVLVKGGHATGEESIDLLFEKGQPVHRFDAPRLPGGMRGTGCMLASAIAAGIASGKPLERSVSEAKQYVFDKLSAALKTSLAKQRSLRRDAD